MSIAPTTPLPVSAADVERSVRKWLGQSALGRLRAGGDIEPELVVRLGDDEVAGDVEWRRDPFGMHVWWWPGGTAVSIRYDRFAVEELRADDSMSWSRDLGPGELHRAVTLAGDVLAGCSLFGPGLIHPAVLAIGRCGTCFAEGTLERRSPVDSREARLHAAGVPQIVECRACGTRWLAPHRDDPDTAAKVTEPSAGRPTTSPAADRARIVRRRSWAWQPSS